MKKLAALLGLLVLPASLQAQAIEEQAKANSNGRVGNTTRIEALENRADETDTEQAVQDGRLDALEAGSGAPQVPNWVIFTADPGTSDFAPDPNIHVTGYPSSRSEATASLLMRITTLSGREVWVPGVWAGVNDAVTPTWQGTESVNYAVLGYPPGAGCTGDPTALVVRTNSAPTRGFSLISRWYLAFDPRTGIVWRPASGGGSTFDGDSYDVYEYGLEKGWFPGQSTQCRTITVGTTPEYPGNGRTIVLENPIQYAQTTYIYDGVAPRPNRTIAPTGAFD